MRQAWLWRWTGEVGKSEHELMEYMLQRIQKLFAGKCHKLTKTKTQLDNVESIDEVRDHEL